MKKLLKKGQEKQVLTLIILATIGLIGIIAILTSIFADLQTQSVEHACRTSLVARKNIADLVPLSTEFKALYPIECKTQSRTLPEKDLRYDNKTVVREQAKKEISDLMATCWWMFLNGEYHKLFGSELLPGGENKCHVCYSFQVKGGIYEGDDYIDMNELSAYLNTHQYQAGLLKSGSVSISKLGRYDFTQQNVAAGETEYRSMNAGRLLSNKKHMESGVADLSGIYQGEEILLNRLRTSLVNVLPMEMVFVIVSELPKEDLEDGTRLPLDLLEEWNIGNKDTSNGIVFLFSLNNGVMLYGAQEGADIILPKTIVERVYYETVPGFMEQNRTQEAISAFSEGLVSVLKGTGDGTIAEYIMFQNTYSAYIGGGLQGPDLGGDANENAISQGAINLPTDLEIKPDIRYAIVYMDSRYSLLHSWFDATQQPNMIGLQQHDTLQTTGAMCNEYVHDG